LHLYTSIEMFREKLSKFLESTRVQNFIIGLILFNSVIVGLETWPFYLEYFGHITDEIDLIILLIFVIEIVLKIYAFRLGFLSSLWNLFDALVVFISILPAAGSFSVFRALRILRTLRLVNNLPKLKLIIESFIYSLPSIGWIVVMLSIIIYIFAVIGYNIFGATFPQFFGTFSKSLFTLFQIMTLEAWASDIARPILEVHKMASIYFVSFILVASYITLNIFIAIVVNTMNEIHMDEIRDEEEKIKLQMEKENQNLLKKIDSISFEIAEIKDLLNKEKK